MLFQDIRDYQILFLSLFLILGIATRDWTLRPELIALAIFTCIATQWFLSRIAQELVLRSQEEEGHGDEETRRHGDFFSLLHRVSHSQTPGLRSPLITSLGISLLLRADSYGAIAIAAITAIASKFIFKVGDKHFFNPANFGIISALVLSNDAWVSPGQWGEEWWYGMLFVGAGGMILQRIGRWDTTAAFLGFYALLEALRNFCLGWTWDVYWHRLMSGSLLLFALFMVTDPRSIPNSRIGRVVWAACIATVTFVLRNHFYLTTAVFWALFALAPITVFFDTMWQSPRFLWGVGERTKV